jgi:hypothetical protein
MQLQLVSLEHGKNQQYVLPASVAWCVGATDTVRVVGWFNGSSSSSSSSSGGSSTSICYSMMSKMVCSCTRVRGYSKSSYGWEVLRCHTNTAVTHCCILAVPKAHVTCSHWQGLRPVAPAQHPSMLQLLTAGGQLCVYKHRQQQQTERLALQGPTETPFEGGTFELFTNLPAAVLQMHYSSHHVTMPF